MTGPCLAMLPTIIDDLQVEFVPSFLGEKSLQVLLGLEYASSVGQFPALGQSMNMGIDGKGGKIEGLSHHHRGCLVSYAGKFLQFGEGTWHLSFVSLDNDLGKPLDGLGFARSKTARSNDCIDAFNR